MGPALLRARLLALAGGLLLPLAGGSRCLAVPLLMTAAWLSAAGLILFSVNAVGLRQAMTAERLRGRVDAKHSEVSHASIR